MVPTHTSDGRPRLLTHIRRDLLEVMGHMVDEYFSVAATDRSKDQSVWPSKYKWIACYAVTGGSEGHYIHIDAVTPDEPSRGLFLGKTFLGMDHAQKIASMCSKELGA